MVFQSCVESRGFGSRGRSPMFHSLQPHQFFLSYLQLSMNQKNYFTTIEEKDKICCRLDSTLYPILIKLFIHIRPNIRHRPCCISANVSCS